MIVLFYGLYVVITPANWNWLWFSIALIMNFYQLTRHMALDDAVQKARDIAEENHWKGPYV